MTQDNAASSDPPLPLRMASLNGVLVARPSSLHVHKMKQRRAVRVLAEHAHRRVDALDHLLPEAPVGAGAAAPVASGTPGAATGDESPAVARSAPLSSEALGLSAKLDLVGTEGDEAVPVETKRGRVPENELRSWEPERVQLMGQGLLLREAGYRCGLLYFAGSRTRVRIDSPPGERRRGAPIPAAPRTLWQFNICDRNNGTFARRTNAVFSNPTQACPLTRRHPRFTMAALSAFVRTRPH